MENQGFKFELSGTPNAIAGASAALLIEILGVVRGLTEITTEMYVKTMGVSEEEALAMLNKRINERATVAAEDFQKTLDKLS